MAYNRKEMRGSFTKRQTRTLPVAAEVKPAGTVKEVTGTACVSERVRPGNATPYLTRSLTHARGSRHSAIPMEAIAKKEFRTPPRSRSFAP